MPVSLKESSTKEKYITFVGLRRKYRVCIVVNGKQRHIGYYKNLEDAIKIRDKFLSDIDSTSRINN